VNVQCPQCSTRYLLPEQLLGPGGARVRCPQCATRFVVARPQTETLEREEPGAASPEAAPDDAPAAAAPSTPEAVAVSLLAGLEERLGARFDAARRDGRVLSDLGPELLAAWDAFRAQVGDAGGAEVFRGVLRERWSVDLGPKPPRSR
jgi:predicted Zn finger-like uncharacterized protein